MIDPATVCQSFADKQLKDSSPTATVQKIQTILDSYGIQVEEHWRETCVPYCYAMSVRVVGTTFSVNGKGLTREFARASGYGELMERLQFGSISKGSSQKTADLRGNSGEVYLAAPRELLARNRSWYEKIAARATRFTGNPITAEDVLFKNADTQGKLPAVRMYCLTTRTEEYYPNSLRGLVYTANGCAAGNSPEEALVQAISEIVERNSVMRIINEELCLPQIPDEFLQQFPTAYRIISYIRSQGYRVMVKDGSMGEKFPVICVCIIDRRTGRYHTHLGANPVFKIALERALTESFQGLDIGHVARFEDFLPRRGDSFTGIVNEITQGAWEKSPAFFTGQPAYAFDPSVGFSGSTNRELLQQCIRFLADQGYDILVKDFSCLGFHTYQVIVPGYSECFLDRVIRRSSDLRYGPFAKNALRDPSTASIQDMLGLLMHREQMSRFTSNQSAMHGFLSHALLSADISVRAERFLLYAALGYVYYQLHQRKEALECAARAAAYCPEEKLSELICLKRCLWLTQDGYAPEQVWQLLAFFHEEQTVQALRSCIDGGGNPFGPHILRCREGNCPTCPIQASCCQSRVEELTGLLNQKRSEMSFDAFTARMGALL